MAWNFDTMKEALSEMEKVDYQEFIKAFLSLELSISDRTILNQVYQDYMDEDDLSLISDESYELKLIVIRMKCRQI